MIAVRELSAKYSLKELLNIANLAKSTYFYTIQALAKYDKNAIFKESIKQIFHSNKGRYGYRRITSALKTDFNLIVNHKKVFRLMKELNLICLVRKKKYKSYKGEQGKTAENMLQRNFKSSKPLQKFATDVTEFKLFNTKIYLSPVLDLFNGEILSYSISQSPNMWMIKEMLNGLTECKGAVLHSDQGWQYQQKSYQRILLEKQITQSMSRKGNCLDNAVMENFFGLLKTELLYIQKFSSLDEFIDKLHEYIYYYNNKRIKLKLKGLSPINYRIQSFTA